MTKQEVAALQREINDTCGFKLVVDGIYGPKTAEAYQYYINQFTPRRITTPVPLAQKPWWTSRAIMGLIASGLALLAARWDWQINEDSLTQLLLEVAQFAGLVMAFIGTVRRRAPIDAGAVLPGVRLPGGSAGVPSASETDRREDLFTH